MLARAAGSVIRFSAAAPEDEGKPTWECPGGDCACHAAEGEDELHDHTILFFDGDARRMPGARCRVLQNGRLLNKEAPFADGSVKAGACCPAEPANIDSENRGSPWQIEERRKVRPVVDAHEATGEFIEVQTCRCE